MHQNFVTNTAFPPPLAPPLSPLPLSGSSSAAQGGHQQVGGDRHHRHGTCWAATSEYKCEFFARGQPVRATCAWRGVADGPEGQQLQPASCPCTDSLFFPAPPILEALLLTLTVCLPSTPTATHLQCRRPQACHCRTGGSSRLSFLMRSSSSTLCSWTRTTATSSITMIAR